MSFSIRYILIMPRSLYLIWSLDTPYSNSFQKPSSLAIPLSKKWWQREFEKFENLSSIYLFNVFYPSFTFSKKLFSSWITMSYKKCFDKLTPWVAFCLIFLGSTTFFAVLGCKKSSSFSLFLYSIAGFYSMRKPAMWPWRCLSLSPRY